MSGLVLLCSDSQGVYVPQYFCQHHDPIKWGFPENDADWEQCSFGPEAQWYWESWDVILSGATHKDPNGNVWSLYQDGDLWAVCVELMTDEEYEGYFGEPRQQIA